MFVPTCETLRQAHADLLLDEENVDQIDVVADESVSGLNMITMQEAAEERIGYWSC